MKIKRRIKERTFNRFNKMIKVGGLVFFVHYFSEKSMSSIIDAANDHANDEYDWSLPFVIAGGEEEDEPSNPMMTFAGELPDPIYQANSEGLYRDPENSDRILFASNTTSLYDSNIWENVKYENHWRKDLGMGFVDEFYDG